MYATAAGHDGCVELLSDKVRLCHTSVICAWSVGGEACR